MALYVRDESVNRLAKQAQKVLGTATKTDAIRLALERVVSQQTQQRPLRDRLLDVQKSTLALGKPNADFDDKKFFDDLWDEG